MEKKIFTFHLTDEEIKWLRIAIEREYDLQDDNGNKERAKFLAALSEKLR